MRNANPALKKGFSSLETFDGADKMTLEGAVNKTFILLILLIVSATFSWNLVGSPLLFPTIVIGSILAFIVSLITVFNKKASPITAPIYAVFEGSVLGGISAIYENMYSGIVFNAVTLTIAILLGLLMLYKSRIIQATENFKLGVAAATFGIFIVYMVSFVLGFFGIEVPYIHSSGPIGIGISVFIVVIASLNLVLDFDFIEQGAEQGAPKYMEWFGAFGLLVTLVWLYLEILRLLAKLRKN